MLLDHLKLTKEDRIVLEKNTFIGEEWKDAIQYEDILSVSNYGRVFRKSRTWIGGYGSKVVYKGRIIKHPNIKKGYYAVEVSINGISTTLMVHRICFCTFTNKQYDYEYQVNHIDGNKTNNNINNLEWVTPTENMKHAFKIGLKKPICRPVSMYEMDGTYIKTFESFMAMIKEGYQTASAKKVCDGKYRHHRNKIFKYA